MDLYKIISTLYEEKKRLDRLIESLEALQENGGPVDPRTLKKRRGRKSMSAEEKQKVSERMKQYWAIRRARGTGTAQNQA
jgi:hypothetical protein